MCTAKQWLPRLGFPDPLWGHELVYPPRCPDCMTIDGSWCKHRSLPVSILPTPGTLDLHLVNLPSSLDGTLLYTDFVLSQIQVCVSH
jgi:hypothetical protein